MAAGASTMHSTPRYQQLEQHLSQEINQGRLIPGERLPSIRQLCAAHGLSKATVLHALHRLETSGRIEARPRSGYYVKVELGHTDSALKSTHAPAKRPSPVNVSELLLDIMERSAAFDLVPDTSSSVLEPGLLELNRAIGRAQRLNRSNYHQYYDRPEGLEALRGQIAKRLQRRGCHTLSDEVCITSGCQNSLFLALMATTKAGDVVAVESPGFYGVMQLLEQLDLKVVEIPASPITGMHIPALAEALKQWPIKVCLVSPNFSTPSGSLMPQGHRDQLLQLAEHHDLAVIEDDIYADTAFTITPDPLKAQDRKGRVILCSSLSKSLSRDVRVGWIIGGRWHKAIIKLKLISQLAGSRSVQQGVADFLASGAYDSHLKRLKKELTKQRDYLFTQLTDWPCTPLHRPEGGLATWIELPPNINTIELYAQAQHKGILITPGSLFSNNGEYTHYLRVSYAHAWNDERKNALQILGRFINESAERLE